MVIGFDIDDTLLMTTKKATEILHRDTKYQNINDYHDLPPKVFNGFVEKYAVEILTYEEISPGAIDVLKYLKRKNIKIVLITARDHDYAITSLYFAKNNIPYDEIVFGKIQKGKIAKDLHVELFVDDKENVLDEVKSFGIKTIKMNCKNEFSKHQQVLNWPELKTVLAKYMEEQNG